MTEIITETVIIGGGQAGVPLARALAASDHDVVLIEREHLGGSCVNFGCTPSKAVIASARLGRRCKASGGARHSHSQRRGRLPRRHGSGTRSGCSIEGGA